MVSRTLNSLAVVAISIIAACGSGCAGSTGGGDGITDAGNPTDAGPAPGAIGTACNFNSDCAEGELCLSPAIGAGTDRYCAPSCSSNADCLDFAETSFVVDVPATVMAQGGTPKANVFGPRLERGYACGAVSGQTGKYCQFACSATEALGTDGKCRCLPGYEVNAARTDCVPGPDIQCSIFSWLSVADQQRLTAQYGIQVANPTCDACNSSEAFTDLAGCHTGLFACEIYTTDFQGRCSEILTEDLWNSCLQKKENFTSDCSSCGSCDIEDLACLSECCTFTPSPGTPAPVCMH